MSKLFPTMLNIKTSLRCHKQIAEILPLKNPPIYYFAKNQLSKQMFGNFYLANQASVED